MSKIRCKLMERAESNPITLDARENSIAALRIRNQELCNELPIRISSVRKSDMESIATDFVALWSMTRLTNSSVVPTQPREKQRMASSCSHALP